MIKKQTYYFLYCIVFLSCLLTHSKAQLPSRFINYSVAEGLSQNSVHAIYKDRDGLMWIGTQDGLNSFDGKDFRVYRHDENDSTSISDQFVLSIKEDRDGFLWIGTRSGLNRLDKSTGKFIRYYINPEERHVFQSSYESFYLQPDKSVVILKIDLFILYPQSRRIIKVPKPVKDSGTWLPMTGLSAYYIAANRDLYFVRNIRNGDAVNLGKVPSEIPSNAEGFFSEAINDSTLLIYHGRRPTEVLEFNVRQNKLVRKISSTGVIMSICTNDAGKIIASTSRGLQVASHSDKKVTRFSDPVSRPGLPVGPIICSYKDDTGNFWVGTAGNGVSVSNTSFENFITIEAPQPQEVISSLAIAGNTLYAGMRNGIYKIDNFTPGKANQKFTPFFTGETISALTTDEEGRVWAGIQSRGIYVFDKKGNLQKKLPGGNKEGNVLSMTKNLYGQVLVNTVNGLFIYETKNISAADLKPAKSLLPDTYVLQSLTDASDTVWVAHNKGLSMFSPGFNPLGFFSSQRDDESFLKKTIICAVAKDRQGALWIGTIRSGLYKYSNGKVAHYGASSGLNSDVVYNVVIDNSNRPWVTTSTGISIYDKAKNAFHQFTLSDGVPNASVPFSAFLKTGGYILFGTTAGLLQCHADAIEVKPADIKVKVADIKVNGQSIALQQGALSIIPDNSLINFELASYPAYYPGEIIYQYKLNKIQKEWVTLPKGVKTISYTGLPHGKLTLLVRAASSHGNLPNAAVSSLSINSTPPFWKRTWFFILCFAALFAFAVLLLMNYNRKKFKQKLQEIRISQELQGQRNRIGRDLHDNIGAYTSALIAGINQIKPTNENQQEQVTGLKEYGTSIMGFLRETIWTLNTETITITAFADRLKNYALRIGRNYPSVNLTVQEKIENDIKLPPTQMLNIFRILQEAMQNVYKHANATTMLVLIKSTDILYFEVRDNGTGFSPEIKDGHYGLKNMKERAEESGFSFEIESNREGTVACIKQNTANAALA